MGFLTGGPYYDMIGRTGNNVGRRRNGRNVFSMRPAKSSKPPTALQLDQRLKFALFIEWLRKLVPLLDVGFQHFEKNGSAFNAAVSYNMRHAVTGVSPNFTINYVEAKFSRGVLRKLTDLTVTAAAGALLNVGWKSVIGSTSQAGDQVAVLAYNAVREEFDVLMNAAQRSAEAYELQVPLDWIGEIVHTWVFAVSANGKLLSDSAYVGQVTVL